MSLDSLQHRHQQVDELLPRMWNKNRLGDERMTFLNECGCIFDEELLSSAIDTYCRRNNVYCNQKHRIVLHNNYPTIVISRKHIYVHDLLRAYLYQTQKGFVVHHADFNKLNNSIGNLEYITSSKHTKIHANHNWQQVREGEKTIKRNPPRRDDIKDEDIKRMREDGIPVADMAKHYHCHQNTIYNRMKKIDWSVKWTI